MTRQKRPSPRAGRAASKVLRDGRTGRKSKIAAGSALSQRAPKKKKIRFKERGKNSFFNLVINFPIGPSF